jgi:hypothetical protein
MLRIERNQASTLIVTVSELTTIASPNYLFQFIEEQSGDEVFCILTNISTGIPRYDEFIVTDGVDVTFPYNGFYTYKIYQQTSSVNLDPDLSQGLVEEGRAHVYEIDSPSNEYNTLPTSYIYE